jgi:hypothetical protein
MLIVDLLLNAQDFRTTVYVNPPGDRAMRMRFWSGITRGQEKWVKLALGHFLGVNDKWRPRAFHSKARSHSPITALRGCFSAWRHSAIGA